MHYEVLKQDITTMRVDAIVNAADTRLRGGGGVDGAIHRAAGPQLLEELKQRFPAGMNTGDAVVTDAYNLPCRYVIHAAGPVYSSTQDPERLLRASLQNTLQRAEEHECSTIAFPAISAGVFGYPKQEFAHIAHEVFSAFEGSALRNIYLCLTDEELLRTFGVD